jgi:hypothetical protein
MAPFTATPQSNGGSAMVHFETKLRDRIGTTSTCNFAVSLGATPGLSPARVLGVKTVALAGVTAAGAVVHQMTLGECSTAPRLERKTYPTISSGARLHPAPGPQ